MQRRHLASVEACVHWTRVFLRAWSELSVGVGRSLTGRDTLNVRNEVVPVVDEVKGRSQLAVEEKGVSSAHGQGLVVFAVFDFLLKQGRL